MSSSSVITQQVQGLATATSPGLVGTGAQTWAGDKTLTGLVTASGGIINTGLTGANATTVSTSGSGKVGEIISIVASGNTASLNTASTALTVISLSFSPGIWFMTSSAAFTAISSVTSVNNIGLQFTSGTTFDTTASADFWSQIPLTGTQINNGDAVISLKTVFKVSSTTTYNLLARATYSGGSIVVRGGSVVPSVINAVRIA